MLRWALNVRLKDKGRGDYATHSDFCVVFRQHLDRLYSLVLILTVDELRAEECLLAALDSCVEGSLVFKESAGAWSRRSVIKTAIRSMSPVPFGPARHYLLGHRSDLSFDPDASIKWLLELPVFDRFVYVMSVLEGYSDRDCALLLGCSSSNILAARASAFQQISTPRLSKSYASHASGAQPSIVDADWLECG